MVINMSDMDILVKIGYLDAEEPDVDILPANLEHPKYAFAKDCAGVAKMNAYNFVRYYQLLSL